MRISLLDLFVGKENLLTNNLLFLCRELACQISPARKEDYLRRFMLDYSSDRIADKQRKIVTREKLLILSTKDCQSRKLIVKEIGLWFQETYLSGAEKLLSGYLLFKKLIHFIAQETLSIIIFYPCFRQLLFENNYYSSAENWFVRKLYYQENFLYLGERGVK